MKIKYNDYTYFDPNYDEGRDYDATKYNENNENDRNSASYQFILSKRFDASYFNELVNNRQFEDAANYASKFHFNDPEKQRKNLNYITNLRREGRKYNAIFSRIDNKEDLAKIDFADKVFVNGGLEDIVDNDYAKEFVNLKKMLGSKTNYPIKTNTKLTNYDSDRVIDTEATALSITFAPQKQYGIFGWDWIAKDNTKNSIEAFYENTGLSEVQLKSAGVEIERKDGYTTLKFDKTNPLANKLIYNTPIARLQGDVGIGTNHEPVIRGLDTQGNNLGVVSSNDVRDIKSLIDEANFTKQKWFKEVGALNKVYSSTVGPALDDNIAALNEALSLGQIDETTYNRRMKTEGGYILDAIKTLGSNRYAMYSNIYNKEDTDETLRPMDNNQRAILIDALSLANPKNMSFNSMVSNGKIGTLVTINAIPNDNKNIGRATKPENLAKYRRIQVFIPGLFQEQAQAKINNNSTTRAAQEINQMQDWGYPYICQDGTEIYSDTFGKFYINGEEIPQEEAVRQINKNMIIEDAINNLQFEYMNNKGELYDKEKYENMARLIATKAANDLYPGIPLANSDGTPTTINEIFNKKGVGSTLAEQYVANTQYEVYKKYSELFDIYDKIMDGIIYYNK